MAPSAAPLLVHGIQLVGPYALSKAVEPYKRILAVLLRPSCVSLSVSNEYLNLAQPVGAFLLRDGPPGRVPQRTFTRMLAPVTSQISGVLIGCEHMTDLAIVQTDTELTASLREVLRTSMGLDPKGPLPHAWWDKWDVNADASCRIQAPEPASELQTTSASGAGKGEGTAAKPVCSMATLFLQHYLDSLGAMNTFG